MIDQNKDLKREFGITEVVSSAINIIIASGIFLFSAIQ